jgi:ligand-binding sensor domain-containing protein
MKKLFNLLLLSILVLPSSAGILDLSPFKKASYRPPEEKSALQVLFFKSFDDSCKGDSIVWIGTSSGLYFTELGASEKYDLVKGVKETHIKSITSQDGLYWVSTHNGLYSINPKTPSEAKAVKGTEDKIIVSYHLLSPKDMLIFDHKKVAYYASRQEYIAKPLYDPTEITIERIVHNICLEAECKSPNNKIWLIADYQGGLYSINKNAPQSMETVEALKGQMVTDIKSYNSKILITTLSNGLYIASDESLSDLTHVEGLKSAAITTIAPMDEHLILGTLDQGAYLVDLNAPNKLYKAEQLNEFQNDSINYFLTSKNFIWFSPKFNGGVVRISRHEPHTLDYIEGLENKEILNSAYFKDNIWVHTSEQEIFKIDESNGAKVHLKHPLNGLYGRFHPLGDNLFLDTLLGLYVIDGVSYDQLVPVPVLEGKKVKNIYFDKEIIWAESGRGNLYATKPDKPLGFERIKGLKDLNVWNVDRDEENDYFVSTSKGAYVLEKDDFYEAKLLPATSNVGVTALMSKCGEIWIGSLNGYFKEKKYNAKVLPLSNVK